MLLWRKSLILGCPCFFGWKKYPHMSFKTGGCPAHIVILERHPKHWFHKWTMKSERECIIKALFSEHSGIWITFKLDSYKSYTACSLESGLGFLIWYIPLSAAAAVSQEVGRKEGAVIW